MLGMTFVHQEYTKLALPYLLRAAELAPEDVDIQFQYGLCLAQNGQIEGAEQAMKRVLQLEEEHSDAYYNLGVVALHKEDAKSALFHFNRALEIQPEHMLASHAKAQVEQALNE
ncbi:Tetratricopeptide repeat-containing protein [Halobacillus alkaliphilus]|nr:Tetratricopeptide repeat-containing protein [Halobacillus alkaliphilus]